MRDPILDLRDIAQEWREAIESSLGDTQAFEDLCSQLNVEPTPDDLEHFANDYEPTLIADWHFTSYAQELAEDIGAVASDVSWPMYCIDWERAARDLKMDYTTITFDGDDYYIRS